MKKIDYKNLLNKDNLENVIVHVVLHTNDNKEYECVGILMKEEKDVVRVAFNAKDDEVKDYLDINKADIVSIDILDSSEVKKLW